MHTLKIHMKLLIIALGLLFSANALSNQAYENGKYLETERGKIYYLTEGEGVPAILVNGGPGAGHRVFLGWFTFLTKLGYKVVYFDDIGRGRSTRDIDGKFSPQMTVDDIEALRKHLGAEKVTLIAHSYGGIPAAQYALQHSDKVQELIMLNASYDAVSHQKNIDNVNNLIKSRYPQTWQKMQTLLKNGVSTKTDEYADLIYSGPAKDELQLLDPKMRSQRSKYPSRDKRDRFNFDVYFDIMGEEPELIVGGTLKGLDIQEQIHTIKVPTLVIGGRYDNLSTPEMVHDFYKALPKQTAQLVMFEQSRHWPWVEEPEKFVNVVTNFLQ